MKRSVLLLVVLFGPALSSCATHQQIDIIEREQRRLRGEYTAAQGDFDSIRSDLADTRANVQQVQRDLGVLKERVDELRHQTDRQIGRSVREGDQRIKELETRLARMDEELRGQAALLKSREEELRALRDAVKAGQLAKEATVLPGAEAPKEVAGGKSPAESEAEKKDYDVAWRLVEKKDYRAAIARFREFLKKYTESEYADNAQYWIGESHYALREFDQAILAFDDVERKYPNGDKVPAALLKQGFAFVELGDKVDARLILRKLLDRFPNSPEAAKAKQKLKSLES